MSCSNYGGVNKPVVSVCAFESSCSFAHFILQFAANFASREWAQVQTAQLTASSKLSHGHHFGAQGHGPCSCARRSTKRHGRLAFVSVSAPVCYHLEISLPSSGAVHGEVSKVSSYVSAAYRGPDKAATVHMTAG